MAYLIEQSMENWQKIITVDDASWEQQVFAFFSSVKSDNRTNNL